MREKVKLLIGGKEFGNWTEIEIKLSLDSFDTVSFSAPFEPQRAEFAQIFEPFTFKPVKVLVGGALMFNGSMVGIEPQVDENSSSVAITAYSQPGVLCDCTAPSGFGRKGRRSALGPIPLEFTDSTLQTIAAQLCEPFGIGVVFQADTGAQFAKVRCKIEEKIHSFLVELAKQRGLVVTNTPDGKLLFWKSVPAGLSAPVAQFIEGQKPLTAVRATFSPQEYYSEITGYTPAKHGKPGGKYTFLNPWLGDGIDTGKDAINAHRPMSCKFDDTERADAPDAVKAKVARMFANAAAYSIERIPGWRDHDGKLWTPNTILTLLAPSAMIYNESAFLIREVTLKQTPDIESASFNLVLPGAFSGEIPERLPWHKV